MFVITPRTAIPTPGLTLETQGITFDSEDSLRCPEPFAFAFNARYPWAIGKFTACCVGSSMSTAVPLRLPFWALVPSVSDSHVGATGLLPAFSDSATLATYMADHKGSDRHIRLVTRDTLVLFLADAHLLVGQGIRLDPKPDGTGGTEVPISELMKLT
jgi:hypothetical protein